jgi:PTS system nitrogen regulatory IIA component
MELALRDVAKLFSVSERTVHRWIKESKIPVHKVLEQYRFHRAELLEWAVANNVKLPADIFESKESEQPLPKLSMVLRAGGVYYAIKGSTKKEVLTAAINSLKLPSGIDKEFLLSVILAREELASTAVGEGIAIPHPRNPIVLPGKESFISLCFLEKPIEFGALDSKPVHCLFTLVSSTVRMHLHLLSRLAFVLQNARVKEAILQQKPAEDILRLISEVEK